MIMDKQELKEFLNKSYNTTAYISYLREIIEEYDHDVDNIKMIFDYIRSENSRKLTIYHKRYFAEFLVRKYKDIPIEIIKENINILDYEPIIFRRYKFSEEFLEKLVGDSLICSITLLYILRYQDISKMFVYKYSDKIMKDSNAIEILKERGII